MNRSLPVVSQYPVWFFIFWRNRRSINSLSQRVLHNKFPFVSNKNKYYVSRKKADFTWKRKRCVVLVAHAVISRTVLLCSWRTPMSKSEYLISAYANAKSPWIKSSLASCSVSWRCFYAHFELYSVGKLCKQGVYDEKKLFLAYSSLGCCCIMSSSFLFSGTVPPTCHCSKELRSQTLLWLPYSEIDHEI